MRTALTVPLLALGVATSALAQQDPRLEVGPVARVDRVTIEHATVGATAVAGAFGRLWFNSHFGIEGELTQAGNRLEHSYEGWFISYAGPDASRDDIERLAPRARRTLGYSPGLGWSIAFAARGDLTSRVGLTGRVGLYGRRYDETSAYTILSTPEGVDPLRVARDFEPSSRANTRGGLLLAVDAPIATSGRRFTLAPEVRFVYGGLGDYKHVELGVGARGVWRF